MQKSYRTHFTLISIMNHSLIIVYSSFFQDAFLESIEKLKKFILQTDSIFFVNSYFHY